MSSRSGIAKAMASLISTDINGTGDYVNNLYTNVTNKVTHFDKINDFPFVSVTPGPETREDLPSNFSWGNLTLFIRVYVKNNDDAQGQLESIISDIETFVDTHLNLSYNVTTPQGVVNKNTTDNSIVSIATDEGILDPFAIGEVVLDVRYEKIRKF
jgi:hypothetical protein